jgi:hypothetical protein
MERGARWGEVIVAGDVSTSSVYYINPAVGTDYNSLQITRVVTGMVPMRLRTHAQVDGLFITASLGAPIVDGADLSMRFSDDNGNTWSTAVVIDMSSGNYSQELAFRSLGVLRAPGRIFEITDVGGAIRIDGCDAVIAGAS